MLTLGAEAVVQGLFLTQGSFLVQPHAKHHVQDLRTELQRL